MMNTNTAWFLKLRYEGDTKTGKPVYRVVLTQGTTDYGTKKSFSVNALLKSIADSAEWISKK